MVDMGQAEVGLRSASVPAQTYSWKHVVDVSPASRGEYCVIRQCSGRPELLRIAEQQSWKEWVGVFSHLGHTLATN